MSENFQYGITMMLLVLNGSLVVIPVLIILWATLGDVNWDGVGRPFRKWPEDQGIRK